MFILFIKGRKLWPFNKAKNVLIEKIDIER